MSEHATVLYDAPGPRTRARHRIYTVVGTAALAAVAAWVVWRLGEAGQFASALWSPYLSPQDENFDLVWGLIRSGALSTAKAALLAVLFSFVFGLMLGAARMLFMPAFRWPVMGIIELLRGTPVVIAIYFASRVMPTIGMDLDGMPGGGDLWYLVIGLTAYNSVVIAEILRAGVMALPKGQTEAAQAIGLSTLQTWRIILLPQAIRIMLPALISQLVVIVKDTSLSAVLGLYDELLKQGKLIALNLDNPIQTYFVIGVMFVVVNMALSALAHYTQVSLSRR